MTDQASPSGWRTFVVLWLSQSLSTLGDFALLFATTIWLSAVVYPQAGQRGELAAALAAVNLAAALPALAGTSLFGVWVDRYDRRTMMVAANAGNAALSAVMAALLAGGNLTLGTLLLLVAVMSAISELHTLAFDTSYVMVVAESRLPRANGLMQTTWSIADVAGPAVASGLIALPAFVGVGPGLAGSAWLVERGVALAVAFNAASFAVAAGALLFLRIPSPRPRRSGERLANWWAEASEGVRFLWRQRPLLLMLTLGTVQNFVAAAAFLLLPLLVRFDLAADWSARGFSFEAALALLLSVASFGGVVGGLLVSAWGGLRRHRIYGVVVPMIAGSVFLLGAGLSRALFLTAALLLLSAATDPITRAHAQSIWQTRTPPELQGRVFAARVLVSGGMVPVGAVFAGWVGGVFDPGAAIVGLGAVLTVYGVLQLLNPTLLGVEKLPKTGAVSRPDDDRAA